VLTSAHCPLDKGTIPLDCSRDLGFFFANANQEYRMYSWSELYIHNHPSYPKSKPSDGIIVDAYDVSLIRLPEPTPIEYPWCWQVFASQALELPTLAQMDGFAHWNANKGRSVIGDEVYTNLFIINDSKYTTKYVYRATRDEKHKESTGGIGEDGDSGGPLYNLLGSGFALIHGVELSTANPEEGLKPDQKTKYQFWARIDTIHVWAEELRSCYEHGYYCPQKMEQKCVVD